MAARGGRDDRSATGAGAGAGSGAASSGGPGRTAGSGGPASSDGTTPGTTTPRSGRAPAQSTASRLAWIAVAVAGLLTAWQVVYALTAPTSPNAENYASVSLLLTLVLSVGAIVLGIVALGQRAQPRWPATSATAVGVFAFIVCVATWIGTLMA